MALFKKGVTKAAISQDEPKVQAAAGGTYYISDVQGRNDRAFRGSLGELIVTNVINGSHDTAIEARLQSRYNIV
jgi:hypothetical protein